MNMIEIIKKVIRLTRKKYIKNRNRLNAFYIRKKYKMDKWNFFSGQKDALYQTAIVAIFKGEDRYLKEWIEFHRIVGVEHFFLYDNGDSEESRQILKPYIQDGVVTYTPFPELNEKLLRNRYGKKNFSRLSMQNLAYGNCVLNYSKYYKWLIKIDIDEFLYPLEPYNSIGEVFDILDGKNIKGFAFKASRFGPSGKIEKSDLPVIETFTKRYSEYDRNWKVAGKSISLDKKIGFHGCHKYSYKFSISKKEVDDKRTEKYLHLNHYYIKSKEEYLEKIDFHSSGHKAGKENVGKWPIADKEADFEDEKNIFRFLPQLKERLNEK